MVLEECETIRECLFWAEEQWPGFWDFATLQPLSIDEMDDLCKSVSGDELFQDFIERVQEVAPIDRSDDGLLLLYKGSQAFSKLREQLDEHYQDTTRQNTNRRGD